jgi:hypothetical protein
VWPNQSWQPTPGLGRVPILTPSFQANLGEQASHIWRGWRGDWQVERVIRLERRLLPTCYPLHYLLTVARLEPALEMNMLDYDWLKKLIEKDPKAIHHIVVPKKLGEDGEGDLVLTADTAELQKFILKHEKTEGAFGKGIVMNRWKN